MGSSPDAEDLLRATDTHPLRRSSVEL